MLDLAFAHMASLRGVLEVGMGAPAAAVGAGSVPAIVEKLGFVWPEIALFVAAVVVMVLGLSPSLSARRLCLPVSIMGVVVAGVLAALAPAAGFSPVPGFMPLAKLMAAVIAVPLLLLMAGIADREYEAQVERGVPFDPIRGVRGEFYAFALFSLMGLMLCATADDLIWLFLALELTSLPTYVMVAISTARARSQEAGVKYFFLGAFGAATFLFGFALMYGAAGTTTLYSADPFVPTIASSIAEAALATGGLDLLMLAGLLLAITGIAFKIAAVPMHFYTPDVYQGAATPIAAFLGFVPKAAGFFSLIVLLTAVGWNHLPAMAAGAMDGAAAAHAGLPEPVRIVLWVMAALTMTVGNVLAWLQKSVKRMLAYSSVAHSGYMLVGLIAGPGNALRGEGLANNGLGAVVFYLFAYGFMNLGAFAVLACLERGDGEGSTDEADSIEDIKGLCVRSPILGWSLVVSVLSLLGFPIFLGFFGKLFLFTSAISAGEIALVVVLGINSAIAAFYYLRIAGAALLEKPGAASDEVTIAPFPTRIAAAVIAASASVVLLLPINVLMNRANEATRIVEPGAGTGAGIGAAIGSLPGEPLPSSAGDRDGSAAPAP
ncbi:MAG: NADH-quinone oxidoreductase subunit N [Phycisphaerales bacterium]